MEEKTSRNSWIALGIIAVVLVVIVLAVVALINNGTVSDSGEYPKPAKAVSLKCTSNTFVYPWFTKDDATGRELTVNVMFEGEDLSSVSVISLLQYKTVEEAEASREANHTAMNLEFQRDGLMADAFSAIYAVSGDKMQTTLYATPKDLANEGARYFMLEGVAPPYRLADVKKAYMNLGLQCK